MVGQVGRSGGARPGAGRKSDATKHAQETYRAQFLAAVSPQDFRACIERLRQDALGGSVAAFREIVPWLAGRVPEETKLSTAEGASPMIIQLSWDPAEPYTPLVTPLELGAPPVA